MNNTAKMFHNIVAADAKTANPMRTSSYIV